MSPKRFPMNNGRTKVRLLQFKYLGIIIQEYGMDNCKLGSLL